MSWGLLRGLSRDGRKSRGHPKDLREAPGPRLLHALGYPTLARSVHSGPSVYAETHADMRVLTLGRSHLQTKNTPSQTTMTHPFP